MASKGPKFYVYAIMDGPTVLYVGKGCGRRAYQSSRKHGGEFKIIERLASESKAFERERHWISELLPQNNICPGGNGGRAKPVSKYEMPKRLRGVVSEAEWRRSMKAAEAEYAEMERMGTRTYAAKTLLKFLDERNCEQWGVSKVDLNRLREVADGCGA